MPESQSHIRLVNALTSCVIDSFLDGDDGYILVDNPDNLSNARPPHIGGFIPDIYVPHSPGKMLIIGEAKTAHDLENKHSLEQIQQFLVRCSEVKNSYFILAVPWHMVGLARAIIKYIVEKIDAIHVKFMILDKLPG